MYEKGKTSAFSRAWVKLGHELSQLSIQFCADHDTGGPVAAFVHRDSWACMPLVLSHKKNASLGLLYCRPSLMAWSAVVQSTGVACCTWGAKRRTSNTR